MNKLVSSLEVGGKVAPCPPRWHSPEEARALIEQELEQFLENVIAGEAEGLTLAIRATAGIGKTIAVLKRLGAAARLLLGTGHIQFMTPTHDLADEAQKLFEALFPEIPSIVFRGRDAKHPSTGEPMCERANLVPSVHEICGSVSQSLCQTWDRFEKRTRQADCFRGCAWRAQIPAENSVIFMSHAYLTTGTPIQGDVVLRVVDEKFFSELLKTNSISIGNWLPKRAEPPAHGSEDERLDRGRVIVLEALRTGAPVNASLRGACFDQDDIEKFRDLERWKAERLIIYPDQQIDVQSKAVRGYDLPGLRAARSRASVWQTIAECWEHDATDRLTLAEDRQGDNTWQSIRIHWRKEINTTVPTILLDADADPEIIETFRPGARFVRIDVAPNATITQIRDRTFSTSSLCSAPKAGELRREVREAIEREVSRAQGGGVLLVATQEVLRALHKDEDRDRPVDEEEDLLVPLFGAEPRWYGPRLQGVNNYKDFETVILVGRLEPPSGSIDDKLRSLTGDRGTPLVTAANQNGTCGWYPAQVGWYLRPGDQFDCARVRHHPDPAGAALLNQSREASMLQAVARIRAVGATAPKNILIFCSIPLPGLPVDRLVCWDEFVTGVPADLKEKVDKLRQAIRLPDGTLLEGLRLSVDGLIDDAPHVFRTRNAAAEWRRDLPTARLRDVINHVARLEGLAMSGILFSGTPGRPTPAVIRSRPTEAAHRVMGIWPTLRFLKHI